jgi:hypothetical protein
MEKTVVEWLVEEVFGTILIGNHLFKKIQQAKEMENERLKEAYSMGRMGKSIKEFNETFKSK